MIMRHIVYSNLYKQQPGNFQGMLSQERAAIRTILRLPDEEQKGLGD